MIRRKEKEEDPASVVRKVIDIDDDVLMKFRNIVEMCESVYCELGKGFSESVYEEALCIELQLQGIQHTSQETIPCFYRERFVGNIRLDILLHSWLPFVFELKAVSGSIQTDERWQLVRYMDRKHTPYGAVVNFNQGITKGLDISFVVNHEGVYYIFDPDTREGRRMKDSHPPNPDS